MWLLWGLLPALFQNFSARTIRPQNLPEQTIINEKNRHNMKHSNCVTCRANDSRVGYCFAIVWSLFTDIFCFVFTVGWFVIDGDKCDSPFPDTSSGSYAQLEVSCCRKSKQHLTEGCEFNATHFRVSLCLFTQPLDSSNSTVLTTLVLKQYK